MAPHAIVHVAIPAPNPAVLGPFYAELFGWKLHDPTFNNYHPFHADSGPNGAFVQVNDTTGPKVGEVVIHVSTDDIDATLARVEALGGKTLHPKTEIPQYWLVCSVCRSGGQSHRTRNAHEPAILKPAGMRRGVPSSSSYAYFSVATGERAAREARPSLSMPCRSRARVPSSRHKGACMWHEHRSGRAPGFNARP